MDAKTLLIGGAVSMLGVEAVTRLRRRYNNNNATTTTYNYNNDDIIGAGDADDDATDSLPFIVDDSSGTLLCFKDSVFYVRNPLMTVTLLQQNDGDDAANDGFELSPHYAALYRKATHMKHRRERLRTQYCIWMLHMVLCDLNTLLSIRRDALGKPVIMQFLNVVANMNQSAAYVESNWWRGVSRTAAAATPRESVAQLFEKLQASGAIRALAAAVGSVGHGQFFYTAGDDANVDTPISAAMAAEHPCGCTIVTCGLRLKYTTALCRLIVVVDVVWGWLDIMLRRRFVPRNDHEKKPHYHNGGYQCHAHDVTVWHVGYGFAVIARHFRHAQIAIVCIVVVGW
jgi:hypothetical protein